MSNKKYTVAVRQIKHAILQSQYQAAKGVNAIQLSLYYGIGRYVSANTRQGAWGTDAIATISKNLQKELPGLRGFGERNIKNMRLFYEAWQNIETISADASAEIKRSPVEDNIDTSLLISLKSADASAEMSLQDFCSIGFSHHLEIIKYATATEERKFYIHLAATRHWNVLGLRDMLRADIYHHQGALPNNFLKTMPDKQDALYAVSMFRDEYFLDFLNIDDIDAEYEQDMNRSVVELAVRSYSNPMGVATYRLPGDVPEEYKAMRPIMEHVQELLAGNKEEYL